MLHHIVHAGLHWGVKELAKEVIATTSPPFDASVLDGEDLVVFEDRDGAIKRVWRVFRKSGGGIVFEGLMYFGSSTANKAAVMAYIDQHQHACFDYGNDLDDDWKACITRQRQSLTSSNYTGLSLEDIRPVLGLLLQATFDGSLKRIIMDAEGNYYDSLWNGGGSWLPDSFWNRMKCSSQKNPYKYYGYGKVYVTNANGALRKAVRYCHF